MICGYIHVATVVPGNSVFVCVLLHLPHNNENCLTFRAVIMLDTHSLIII